jgi:hypothetical protein
MILQHKSSTSVEKIRGYTSVATLCDSAGDDHIDRGLINTWLVLAIIFDRRNPQGGVRGLGCAMLQPNWGHTSLVGDMQEW